MRTQNTMKSGIKKVQVNCNNCGGDDAEFVSYGIEHEYDNTTDDVFTVVKCRRCGLIYLNPRPDVSELKTIYPDNYYAYQLHKQSVECEKGSSPLYRARKYVYLSRLRQALLLSAPGAADLSRSVPAAVPPSLPAPSARGRRAVPAPTGAESSGGSRAAPTGCLRSPQIPYPELKVLDVGCADGRALNWYRQLEDFKVATYGVDFDEKAVAIAREAEHHVYLGRFEEADIPDNMFDLVVATHVIEHVADPRAFALKALKVLRPGGIFLCETPNAAALDARLFRNHHWGGYHFPRHWVFYTPDSIKQLSQEIGFEFVRIDFHPAPAFWNWTFHSLLASLGSGSARTKMRRIADLLFPPVDFQKNNLRNFFAVSFFTSVDLVIKALTRQTSNMAVILRKPERPDRGQLA